MDRVGRIMGLDVGSVRTGVALSDPMQILASPHGVAPSKNMGEAVSTIAAIAAEQEVVGIVLGLPLDQNGERGPQAEKTIAFADALRASVDVPLHLQDERYTTAQAERMLIAANVRRGKRKQVVDKIAATHILQAYLDRRAMERREEERNA